MTGLLGEAPLVTGQVARPWSCADTLPLRSEDLDISEEKWLITACAFGKLSANEIKPPYNADRSYSSADTLAVEWHG